MVLDIQTVHHILKNTAVQNVNKPFVYITDLTFLKPLHIDEFFSIIIIPPIQPISFADMAQLCIYLKSNNKLEKLLLPAYIKAVFH